VDGRSFVILHGVAESDYSAVKERLKC